MNRLGWVFILPFLTACAWSESRVSQQPRTTAPSGITSPTGYFDYLEVLNGGIFNSYGNSTFGNNPNFDKVTMQAYIYGNLIPDASPSTVSLLGTASRPWSAYISAATLNTLYPAGSILSVDGDFEVLNGRTFKSWGDTYIGNHPVFDKLQVNAYIEGNLIPDASPSTVSSLGSDARPWTAKLRDATANNLFVNEYVNIGREDTQRGILRLFGGASNPPVMYWYNSDNVDSPENYWYAYPWGEVFFFYPSTGSPNGFTYTALGQFQCNQASFTQQLYAANIKSSTGTNTFGGNATLGGNTLTAGAVTWTTGTGTFGAAGKTANFPGSVQVANLKNATGTLTYQHTTDLGLQLLNTEAATSQPLGTLSFRSPTWGNGVFQTLAQIEMGKMTTTDNQQAGKLGFYTMRDSDDTLYEWARLHPTGFFEFAGRAAAGNWSVPLVISNRVAADNTGAGLAFNLRGDLDPSLYQKCMIVLDGVNDGGAGWGKGYLKILMNNTSSSVNATLSDAVFTIDNTGSLYVCPASTNEFENKGWPHGTYYDTIEFGSPGTTLTASTFLNSYFAGIDCATDCWINTHGVTVDVMQIEGVMQVGGTGTSGGRKATVYVNGVQKTDLQLVWTESTPAAIQWKSDKTAARGTVTVPPNGYLQVKYEATDSADSIVNGVKVSYIKRKP